MRRQREANEKARERAQEEAEIEREMTSREMNEDMTLAVSASDANRFRPDHFKGLLPDQIQAIKDTQRQQVEDAKVCLFSFSFFSPFLLYFYSFSTLLCISSSSHSHLPISAQT